MPSVPAQMREHAIVLLQGGMGTTDVARAINYNVLIRCLKHHYRKTGRTSNSSNVCLNTYNDQLLRFTFQIHCIALFSDFMSEFVLCFS